MKTRVTNPKASTYDYYGGRGLTVYPPWLDSFEQFLRDMGECPEGMTLERIDNAKGYSPDNCRWASKQDQANNRRSSKLITYQGQTLTLAQWSAVLGIKSATIGRRLLHGWSVSTALTKPVRKGVRCL